MSSAPVRKRPNTVAALLDGAERAFAERGFHGASIGFICESAGMTTGAFYSNFADKYALFGALYERRIQGVLDRMDERLGRVGRGADLARTIAVLFESKHPDRPCPKSQDQLLPGKEWLLLTTEFRLLAFRNPEAAAALAEGEHRIETRVGQLIDKLLSRADRRPMIPGTEIARLVLGMNQGLALQAYGEETSAQEANGERMIPMILEGFSEPL